MTVIVLFCVAGIICGTGQFFLLRAAVSHMLQKNRVWLLLLQPLVPAALFLTTALTVPGKLWYAAVTYTATLVVFAVINLSRSKNKKD